MDKPASPWSVPVAVQEIPEDGLHMDIQASVEARAGIAKLAGLRDLPELSAAFDLACRGDAVHVSGRVEGRVGQTCVVSLEPIENRLDEPVDLIFTRAGRTPVGAEEATEEAPEPLVDGKVDLGALATEFLMLGIDPYPRKPGAEFAAPRVKDEGEHPFAALAALKERQPGGKV